MRSSARLPTTGRVRSVVGIMALFWASIHAVWAADGGQSLPVPAAISVRGLVRDETGRPLTGANVTLGSGSVRTDADGAWTLMVEPGRRRLLVELAGYHPLSKEMEITTNLGPIEVTLSRPLNLRENVVVQAVRADVRDPVTKTDLGRAAIAAVNRGQEMPFLLGMTPSVTFQSDNGLAAGYSYFTIRGIGQTRLNVTLDGIPLQDPEDQALYFSNFGDFASVVDSVQIQRGVGTSTVGAASYGGSVNFASVNPEEKPAVEVQLGGGSWGSARGTVALHSGLLAGGFALFGRVSIQQTDGFRDHSGVDQRTAYFGATRQDARSVFKLFGFSGRTRTQLAFLAADADSLAVRLRTNPLTRDERDDFSQEVVHAQYTRLTGVATTVMAQGYYNGAGGWFRIWDADRTHLQQYGLDGRLVGFVLGVTHERRHLSLNWGAHANDFRRDHFMDWVGGPRQYLNTGLKRELNSFLKATWEAGRFQWWADGQVRHAHFRYRGPLDLGSVQWSFFNPKAGARFEASRAVALYASIGRMSREPARSDLLAGEDNASLPYDFRAVKPERVIDMEAGLDLRRPSFAIHANAYAMEFRDEIALSGELSEIGLPVRRNVPRSSRRGLELECRWQPADSLALAADATFSRNRIAEWTQHYDVYDSGGAWTGSVSLVHRDVPPLLTPAAILSATAKWMPHRTIDLALAGRWVDHSHLDNTGNSLFRTPSFLLLDAQAALDLSRFASYGHPRLRIHLVNLLDQRRAWPGGYSYLYFNRDRDGRDTPAGTSYFFPLASRSIYLTLDVRF